MHWHIIVKVNEQKKKKNEKMTEVEFFDNDVFVVSGGGAVGWHGGVVK
jgi:hypothetical protein